MGRTTKIKDLRGEELLQVLILRWRDQRLATKSTDPEVATPFGVPSRGDLTRPSAGAHTDRMRSPFGASPSRVVRAIPVERRWERAFLARSQEVVQFVDGHLA